MFLKFIFFYTKKNNKFEKGIANAFIEKEMKIILTSKLCYKISQNFEFFENILNLYIENKYIPLSTKERLIIIKQVIKEKSKIFIKKQK